MIPIVSDSVANIAYSYFKGSGDHPHYYIWAAYCMGMVNYELKRVDKAVRYLLEVSKGMESVSDPKMGYLIFSTLAEVYVYRKLNDCALESIGKAYAYAVEDSTQYYLASALGWLGRIHNQCGHYDSAVSYYKKAIQKAEQLRDTIEYINSSHELSTVLYNHGEKRTALNLLKETLQFQREANIPITPQEYYELGSIYYHNVQVDSACYYLKRSLENNDNLYTQKAVYKTLLEINLGLGDWDLACLYNDSLLKYEGLIADYDESNTVINYKEKYERERLMAEKREMEYHQSRKLNRIVILFVILLCICTLFICLSQRKLIEKQKKLQKQSQKLKDLSFQLYDHQLLIERNNREINRLHKLIDIQMQEVEQTQAYKEELKRNEALLAEVKSKNESLIADKSILEKRIDKLSEDQGFEVQQALDKQKDIMTENRMMRERISFLCEEIVAQDALITGLKRKNKALDLERKGYIKNKTDYIYNHLYTRLRELYPSLSEDDMLICCLIRLGFDLSQTAACMGISPHSLSRRKLRIKAKVSKDATCSFVQKSLDAWLFEYI